MKERFAAGFNPDSSLFLYVYNDENLLVGQENFEYKPFKYRSREPAISMDVNLDGVKEVILFTQNADSLFLNVFDYAQTAIVVESRFVTRLGGYNSKQDFDLHSLGSFDTNGDLIPELFLMIDAGFALNPRRLFRYDYANDSIIASINTGAALMPGVGSIINGEYRIMVSASAYGNTSPEYPELYHDSCGWIFGFDQNLQMLFEPVSTGSYPFQLSPINIINGKGYCFASSRNTASNLNRLLIVNFDGAIEEGPAFPENSFSRIDHISSKGKPLYYLTEYGLDKTYFLEPATLRLTSNRLGKRIAGKYMLLNEDVDRNGMEELLMINPQGIHADYYAGGELKHGVELTLNQGIPMFVTANYYPQNRSVEVIFSASDRNESFQIIRNPRFKFRYLAWFAIYAVSVAFVSAIMYLQRRRIEKRLILENQVANLQLQNLRNQLDPHFTFNALNSVGNAIYQENKEKAYDLFHRFTRMIRSSLMVSNEVFRSLEEEIQFTSDYLEFQLTRFRDLFEYSFDIEPNLDLASIQIPKMLIQGFAENAVKHAFYGIDYKGLIHISISRFDSGIQITIEDNGIGITKSKELGATSGTQKGEQIIKEQIRQINKLYNRDISIQILDGRPRKAVGIGTIIEILLR